MKKLLALLLASLAVCSLAACGERQNAKQESTMATIETTIAATEAEHEETSTNSDFSLSTIYESEDQLIWKIGDADSYVVYHDGTNVTQCFLYTKADSEEEAKETAEALQSLIGTEGYNIKNITSKGKYIVYEYSEDGFVYKTYEEAKAAFDIAKQIIDMEAENVEPAGISHSITENSLEESHD